jgi:hypothetical protein
LLERAGLKNFYAMTMVINDLNKIYQNELEIAEQKAEENKPNA